MQSLNDNDKGLAATGPALDINLALSPGVGGGDTDNLQLFGLTGYGAVDPLSLETLGQFQQQHKTQSHDGSTSSVFSDSHNHNYSIGRVDGSRRSASGNAHSDVSDTMNDGGQSTSNTSYSLPDGQGTGKNGNAGPSEEELYQRRKAQNRAAQRAFRERKEGKIKELSNRLQDAEESRERLEKQLSELRERNKRLNMENQMLQKQQQFQQQSQTFQPVKDDAYSSPGAGADVSGGGGGDESGLVDGLDIQDILSFKFPNTSKYEFINGTIDWNSHGHGNESGYHASKIGESYRHDSSKLLTISAVWDYLVEFANLNEEYKLDIPGIMNELRGKEVCHGFGPAYTLQLVNDIVCRHIKNEE